MAKVLKRKQIRMILAAANSGRATSAVLVRCRHYPGAAYALMSVEKLIEHQRTCQPERISETVTAMELPSNGNH